MISVKPINLSEADKVRFWFKVDMRGPDECWEWQACHNGAGYGHFKINGSMYLAHRVAFIVTNGDTELLICHTCDNPSCCNPNHLYAGTMKDDCRDRDERGRAADQCGENNGYVKLTEDDVREIRELRNDCWLQREIADIYGISRSHVGNICTGKNWKHI